MKSFISILLSISFLTTPLAYAQTQPLPASSEASGQLSDSERELQRFEDLMLQFALSDDPGDFYSKEMEPTLHLLFPNPAREDAIRKERAKREKNSNESDAPPGLKTMSAFAGFQDFVLKLLLEDYTRARYEQLNRIQALRQTDPKSAEEQLETLIFRMDKLSRYELENPVTNGQRFRLVLGITVGVLSAASMIPGLFGMFVGMAVSASVVGLPVGMFLLMIGFIASLPGAGLTILSAVFVVNSMSNQPWWNPTLKRLLDRYQDILKTANGLPNVDPKLN